MASWDLVTIMKSLGLAVVSVKKWLSIYLTRLYEELNISAFFNIRAVSSDWSPGE